jgi:signal transduction histidine kinase
VTARTVARITHGIVAAAMTALAIGMGIALVTYPRADPHTFVVVPQELRGDVEAAVAALREDPGAPIEDPAVAEAAMFVKETRDEIAATGRALVPDINVVAGVGVAAVIALWLGTGSVIVGRQPGNLAGWMFLALGTCFAANFTTNVLVFAGLRGGASWIPLMPLWALVGEYTLVPAALLPLMWLLFPDGHPPSERWRWVMWGFLIAMGIAQLAYFLTPGPLNNFVETGVLYMNPFGVNALASIAPVVSNIGGFAALFLTGATVVGVRRRFKRAVGEERQQLRWLVFVTSLAAVLFLILFVGLIVAELLGAGEDASEPLRILGVDPVAIGFGLTFLTLVLGVPASYLIAVFRYRLWDLDLVVRKTLVFGILVASFMGLGGATAIVLTTLASASPMFEDPVNVWLVGLAIGVLVTPLYRLSTRIADRIVFGGRATPYEVLTEFSGRIGATYADDDVLARMAHVLADGTGASSVRVLLRIGPDLQEAASVGDAPALDGVTVPVVHQGEDLGALAVTMPASDPMSPAKERLVRDLAGQAGPVLRNVRLIEALRASRQRLVAAQDQERRRLERNIHDGVQQQLVALQVQQRLAQQLVDHDPARASAMLDQLQRQTGQTLEDLRDLARGIYPPLLADRGLPAALEAQARKAAVPTILRADSVGRYPQDVEAAVYFSVLEALNNVAKYAEASSAEVSLAHQDGALVFTVRDDGRGFDTDAVGYGTGLQGITDRLDAIGGSVTIDSAPGSGTRITGRVAVQPSD